MFHILQNLVVATKSNFVRAEVADTIRRCKNLTMIHYDFDSMDVQCQICSANRIRHAVSHSVGLKRLPFIFPTFPTFPTLKYVPLILVFWLHCRAYQGAGLRHIQCFSVFWCRGCCKNFPEVLLVKVVPMFQVDSFSNGGAFCADCCIGCGFGFCIGWCVVWPVGIWFSDILCTLDFLHKPMLCVAVM